LGCSKAASLITWGRFKAALRSVTIEMPTHRDFVVHNDKSG
jgi:hypothetical protein